MGVKQKKYHLYVVRPQDIDGAKEKHYLITTDYSLLYTQNKPPVKSEIFTNYNALPAPAWEWLVERINIIRTEYLIAHQKELLEQAENFADKFMQELEKEKQKLEETQGTQETE